MMRWCSTPHAVDQIVISHLGFPPLRRLVPTCLPATCQAAEVARLGRTPVLGLYGTRDSQFPPDMLRGFEVRCGLARAGGGTVPQRVSPCTV